MVQISSSHLFKKVLAKLICRQRPAIVVTLNHLWPHTPYELCHFLVLNILSHHMRKFMPITRQLASSRRPWLSISAPSGTMRLVSSAMVIKRFGPIIPCLLQIQCARDSAENRFFVYNFSEFFEEDSNHLFIFVRFAGYGEFGCGRRHR